MSGDALTSAHELSPLPAIAMEDCDRACARTVPCRKPAQFLQWQFHCGNPPPAADPSTRIFIEYDGSRVRPPPHWRQRLAMYIVISMPNRRSIAVGVSHFMAILLHKGC